MPPPVWPNCVGGPLTSRFQLSAGIARTSTDPTRIPSTQSASSADRVAPPSAALFAIRRRRPRPVALSESCSPTSAFQEPVEAPHDQLGGEVGDERDHEQDQTEIEQRGDVQRRQRARVLVRELARERGAGAEAVEVEREGVADHLRDRDRLAEGAAETEDDRGDDAAANLREDDAAHHLPARRAKPERSLL